MTTNATVEARHRTEATAVWKGPGIEAVAQALANLEAARAESADLTNRLAEIDRIADRLPHQQDEPYNETHRLHYWRDKAIKAAHEIHTLASGHTPSPCPECAAKDEAMEAFRREVSDAVVEFGKSSRFDVARTAESYHSHLSRFIIPPADPVAEALKAVDNLLVYHETGGHEGDGSDHAMRLARAALAELKSRLGGA